PTCPFISSTISKSRQKYRRSNTLPRESFDRLVFGDQPVNHPAHRVGGVASMLEVPDRQTLFAILFQYGVKPAEIRHLRDRKRPPAIQRR
ncbi:hypothetical protein, partial [Sphingomonas sp. Leaf33]|uniref:hypothetical protein n=1 Tax=Sphingomonas sp. Leaf33 TaxID=1736215 RepID=UPI001F1D0D18